MNIRFLPVILICLIGFQANSQKWTNLTTTNVIEDSVVNTIYIDTEQNIWVGTENGGLSKYDGSEWSHFDSPTKDVGSDIRGVDEDLKKQKWFASYGTGVMSFGLLPPTGNARKPEWAFFTYNNTSDPDTMFTRTDGYNTYTYIKSKSLKTSKILCVLVDAVNQKWFGTEGFGAIHLVGNNYPFTWETIDKNSGMAGNVINTMDVYTTNRWFGTNEGLSMYDGTNWYKFNNQGKLQFNPADTSWSVVDAGLVFNEANISYINIDLSGKKWIATDNGVYSFDNTTFVKYTTAEGLVSNVVRNISTDNFNNVYFVSDAGVAVYNQTDLSWKTINSSNGLVCNKAKCVTADLSGNKWFGTDNGLYFNAGNSWVNYKKLSILGDYNVWATAVDNQNTKWFGTYGGGVIKYDGTNWSKLKIGENDLRDSVVISIAVDNSNNKWFGTYEKGLCKYNGSSFTNYNHYDGLAGDCVYSIKIDASGTVWVGTGYGNGVSKLSGSSFTNYGYNNGLAFNDVHSIAIDSKGNKWFGTYGGGLTKYNGTSWVTYDMTDGLVGDYIQSIAIDKNGRKWIATNRGLSMYNDTVFTNYLVGVNVWDVKVDESNIVWAGTWGNGLNKFDGTTWTTYGTKWVDANNSIGLADNRVNSFSIDKNGVKYIGTWKGISILNDGGSKNYEIQQSTELIDNVINSVNVYPIPVGDKLTVEYTPVNPENCIVEVYDVLGKQVSTEQILSSNTSLNFDKLDRGVYMLRITDGDSKYLQKIVKN